MCKSGFLLKDSNLSRKTVWQQIAERNFVNYLETIAKTGLHLSKILESQHELALPIPKPGNILRNGWPEFGQNAIFSSFPEGSLFIYLQTAILLFVVHASGGASNKQSEDEPAAKEE